MADLADPGTLPGSSRFSVSRFFASNRVPGTTDDQPALDACLQAAMDAGARRVAIDAALWLKTSGMVHNGVTVGYETGYLTLEGVGGTGGIIHLMAPSESFRNPQLTFAGMELLALKDLIVYGAAAAGAADCNVFLDTTCAMTFMDNVRFAGVRGTTCVLKFRGQQADLRGCSINGCGSPNAVILAQGSSTSLSIRGFQAKDYDNIQVYPTANKVNSPCWIKFLGNGVPGTADPCWLRVEDALIDEAADWSIIVEKNDPNLGDIHHVIFDNVNANCRPGATYGPMPGGFALLKNVEFVDYRGGKVSWNPDVMDFLNLQSVRHTRVWGVKTRDSNNFTLRADGGCRTLEVGPNIKLQESLHSSVQVIRPHFNPVRDLANVVEVWDATDLANLFQDSAGTTPATDQDHPVGLLRGISPNGRHLPQSDATKKPLLKLDQINGLPCIRFDGVNDFLQLAIAGLAQPLHMFLVVKQVTHVVNGGIVDGFANTSMLLQMMGSSANGVRMFAGAGGPEGDMSNDWTIIAARWDGANSRMRFGRKAAITGNPGTAAPGGITIGAWGGSGATSAWANIDFAYGILCSSIQTDRMVAAALEFLRRKFALI